MKILIIRYSSIGDIVLTSPLIRAMRNQLPGAELHFMTRAAFESLLQHNPNLDRVMGDLTSLEELRAQRYDFVADLQGNGRSKRLCRQLHVPHASYDKQDLSRIWLALTKLDWTDHRHVALRYFDAVRKLGVTPDEMGLECHYLPSDLSPLFAKRNGRVTADLKGTGLPARYAVIAVGAAHPTKRIPLDKLQFLCSQIQAPVVLLGDEADRRRISEAQLMLPERVFNLCGRTSLMQSLQLVDGAAAVVAGDTGLMHVAAACHRPLIVLWACTSPAFGFAPFRCEAAQLEVSLTCRPCHRFGRKRCPLGHYRCMNDHPWQRVAQTVSNLVLNG